MLAKELHDKFHINKEQYEQFKSLVDDLGLEFIKIENTKEN